jgi:hypothetical protein
MGVKITPLLWRFGVGGNGFPEGAGSAGGPYFNTDGRAPVPPAAAGKRLPRQGGSVDEPDAALHPVLDFHFDLHLAGGRVVGEDLDRKRFEELPGVPVGKRVLLVGDEGGGRAVPLQSLPPRQFGGFRKSDGILLPRRGGTHVDLARDGFLVREEMLL